MCISFCSSSTAASSAAQALPYAQGSVLVIRPSVAAVLLPVGVEECSCRDIVVGALPPLLLRPISKHARSLARSRCGNKEEEEEVEGPPGPNSFAPPASLLHSLLTPLSQNNGPIAL